MADTSPANARYIFGHTYGSFDIVILAVDAPVERGIKAELVVIFPPPLDEIRSVVHTMWKEVPKNAFHSLHCYHDALLDLLDYLSKLAHQTKNMNKEAMLELQKQVN